MFSLLASFGSLLFSSLFISQSPSWASGCFRRSGEKVERLTPNGGTHEAPGVFCSSFAALGMIGGKEAGVLFSGGWF